MANDVAVPSVELEFKDFQLGSISASTNAHVKIGNSSLGAKETLITLSDPRTVPQLLGVGKLASQSAYALAVGGRPVYAMPLTTSSAGVINAITETRIASSTGTLSASGSPLAAYEVVVEITTSGSVSANDAAFRVSIDAGKTFTTPLALVNAWVLAGTGITLEFNGAFERFDKFSFSTVAPISTLADVTSAFTKALDSSTAFRFIHLVGASSLAIAAALDTLLESATKRHRYTYALIEARAKRDDETLDEYENAIESEYATFTSTRVMIAVGESTYFDPATKSFVKASVAVAIAARMAAVGEAVDISQFDLGALPGITSLNLDGDLRPKLNGLNFTTLRTFVGYPGYYITNGLMRAPSGSDYVLQQNRNIMDLIAEESRRLNLPFLSQRLRVDATTGFIDEREAQRIELRVKNGLKLRFLDRGSISAIDVSVRRDNNILADKTLFEDIRPTPVSYGKTIRKTLGFRNPALDPASAAVEAGEEAVA